MSQEERRYNKWPGNPLGWPEDKTRCIEEVQDPWGHSYQCSWKRGKGKDGLYCGQHAKRHPVAEAR